MVWDTVGVGVGGFGLMASWCFVLTKYSTLEIYLNQGNTALLYGRSGSLVGVQEYCSRPRALSFKPGSTKRISTLKCDVKP